MLVQVMVRICVGLIFGNILYFFVKKYKSVFITFCDFTIYMRKNYFVFRE